MEGFKTDKFTPAEKAEFAKYIQLPEVQDEGRRMAVLKKNPYMMKFMRDLEMMKKSPEFAQAMKDKAALKPYEAEYKRLMEAGIRFYASNPDIKKEHRDDLVLLADPTVEKFIKSLVAKPALQNVM